MEIYKGFGSKLKENISEYKLMEAKEAYELMQNSSKTSFFKENLIKARSNAAKKENYKGAFNASSQNTLANAQAINNTMLTGWYAL